MNGPATVVVHADMEDALALALEIEGLARHVEPTVRYGVRIETVVLLAHRSTGSVSRTLSFDLLIGEDVSHRLVVPTLPDWPVRGLQDLEPGRLGPQEARAAIAEVVRALRTHEPHEVDEAAARESRAAAEAPDWIAALAIHAPRVREDLKGDETGWSVLVERDTDAGGRFVIVMQDTFSTDVRIDNDVPKEMHAMLARIHVPHLVLRIVDDEAIMDATDVDGTLVFVEDDPVDTLRRTARLLEQRP